ncbi:MAG: COX15/CtaA family protein [Planctomycetes bacterium]|nr:COX15/CtaA family protein [Planctomycetota bacterium]
MSEETKLTGGRFRALAGAVVVATFVALVLGANVTSSGSGLAVPDWLGWHDFHGLKVPQIVSNGDNLFAYPIEKWVGAVFHEHVHRLWTAGLGFLTICLVAWAFLRRREAGGRSAARWSLAALALVCAQGGLGGLTVEMRLPAWVSVLHGVTAQAFFCVVVALRVTSAPAYLAAGPREVCAAGRSLRRGAAWLVIALAVQLLLGAVLRHTGPGKNPAAPMVSHALLTHLAWGLVVVVSVFAVCARFFRERNRDNHFVHPAMILCVLAFTQLLLGMGAYWVSAGGSRPAPAIPGPGETLPTPGLAAILLPSAHLAVGALMIALAVTIALRTFRFLAPGVPAAAAADAGESAREEPVDAARERSV